MEPLQGLFCYSKPLFKVKLMIGSVPEALKYACVRFAIPGAIRNGGAKTSSYVRGRSEKATVCQKVACQHPERTFKCFLLHFTMRVFFSIELRNYFTIMCKKKTKD